MLMISNKKIAIILALFALTYFGMQHFIEVKPTPILQPLEKFPKKIDNWKVTQKQALSAAVSKILGVDDYIDYTYTNSQGEQIGLYASYFGDVGVTGAYHSPQHCLPGAGWNILSVERVPILYNGNHDVKINRMTVVNSGRKLIVYYWYQERGRIVASEYWDKIYTVLDSLFMHRRDGSFIRVISDNNDDQAAKAFSQKVATLLNDYLPGR